MTSDSITPYPEKLEQRVVFTLVFIGVFVITFGFLFAIDFLPEKRATEENNGILVPVPEDIVSGTNEDTSMDDGVELDSDDGTIDRGTDAPVVERDDALPLRIVFDSLGGRSVKVLNPESRATEALDTALLSGVVRHPDSADFERTGTIFLFGHSSYLPNVMNKNFQAFNGVQKLVWGDIIRLESKSTVYAYRVDRVFEASALDAEVKIETGKAKLTLVTCDSFGAKSDRFVVEATLVESTPIEA